MTQRMKLPKEETVESPEYHRYIKQLTLLHEMLVYVMKSKQSTDLSNVEKLRSLLYEFNHLYSRKEHGKTKEKKLP